MVFFVKYEFWPNYLKNLNNNNIPTFLLAGLFRKNHWFFKWYGLGFLNVLKSSITHFFVQNKDSMDLLLNHNITNCTLMGDSRFDRVNALLDQNNELSAENSDFEDFFGKKSRRKIKSQANKTQSRLKKKVRGSVKDISERQRIAKKNVHKKSKAFQSRFHPHHPSHLPFHTFSTF